MANQTDLATFEPWPKIPRLRRDILITEKIDGTNAQVSIRPWGLGDVDPDIDMYAEDDDFDSWAIRAGSRKRWLTTTSDNFGFRAWVHEHRHVLAQTLGEGRHYGEWYGQGIQRGYGLDQRYFALFNAYRWREIDSKRPTASILAPPILEAAVRHRINLWVVPVLYVGPWSEDAINSALDHLGRATSYAGYGPAEGIVVYHRASNSNYKVLLENDHVSKTEAGVS